MGFSVLKRLEQLEGLPERYTEGQMPLESRISNLSREIETAEKRGRTASLLGSILPGKESLDEMRTAKASCESMMGALKAPVENPDSLRDASDTVRSFDRMLQQIRTGELDQVDLEYLLTSDMKGFLSGKLGKKLEIAQTRMIVTDRAMSAVDREKIKTEAEQKAWEEKMDLKASLAKGADSGRDEGYRELLRRQASDDPEIEKRRQHRWARKAELWGSVLLADKLAYDDTLQLTNILLEARAIRMEQIRQYLRKRYEAIRAAYENNKETLDKETQAELQELFDMAGDQFWQIDDIGLLEKRIENLNLAEGQLGEGIVNLSYIESHRPEVMRDIRERYQALQPKILQFQPQIPKLIEAARVAEVQRLWREGKPPSFLGQTLAALKNGSKIFKNQIEALEALQKGEGFAEFEKSLQGLAEAPALDLQHLLEKLAGLERTLGAHENIAEKIDETLDPSGRTPAQIARKAINKLATVQSLDEIQRILKEEVGEDHVEYVTNEVFESEYRPYTTTGHMVFYERGAAWKIIVDKAVFEDPKNVRNLQKQLTHELLHLEFERNDILKAKWVELYTKDSHWPAIKQAFVDAYPDKCPPDWKPKPPQDTYTVGDWSNEAVLSELYAMQNELGVTKRPNDKSPKGKLNNLLAASGIGLKALGIENSKAEAMAKEIIRGYEGGEDDHGGGHGGGDEDHGGGHDSGHELGGYAGKYAKDLDLNEKNIRELLNSEYVGFIPGTGELLRLMKKFNDQSKEFNHRLSEHPTAFMEAMIGKRIKDVQEVLSQTTDKFAQVGGKIPNQHISVFRKIWIQSTFLSIEDLIQVGKDVTEFIQRRHHRKVGGHAAKLGEALFAGTDIAREAHARGHHHEEEEVGEWEKRIKHYDAWHLQHMIHEMASGIIPPNKDQMKAILRSLCEKGRVDWRDPHLWEVLNKLQGAVHLTPNDPVILHNPPLMRQKLHTATGAIWDYDEFLKLERQNVDAYDSGKKKFESSMDAIQDQLTDRMDQLYHIFKEGGKVDPQEYEEAIEYAVLKGKSNAEAAFFYLVLGMADGLLAPDRGMVLDKHLNMWPATQWIYNQNPPLNRKDYQFFCKKYFNEEYENGRINSGESRFKSFYWTTIQNDPMTIQRVRKSVSERGWDHDWTRTIATLGDANTAKRFLSGKSGQQETKDTGVENAYVGALQWLEENARVADKIDFRKQFTRQMSWIAMADGIVDYVAYNRGAQDIYTRGNESMFNAIAREAGVGRHGNWNVRQHRNKMRRFMSLFDADLFAMLRDERGAKAGNDGATLGVRIRDHLLNKPSLPGQAGLTDDERAKLEPIHNINDVYDNMDLIMQIITSERYVSRDQFLANIETLKND